LEDVVAFVIVDHRAVSSALLMGPFLLHRRPLKHE
jgi:hypothetical protein